MFTITVPDGSWSTRYVAGHRQVSTLRAASIVSHSVESNSPVIGDLSLSY